MDVLINFKKDKTANVVSLKEIKVGESLVVGMTKEGKQIVETITEIHEQRKERGTYDNESKRRNWAHVSYRNVQNN